MKIVSWNVNSLNVRMNHLAQWLDEFAPDVVALQETKLEDHRFPRDELEHLGYESIFLGQKTYNGVAILSRAGLDAATYDFDDVLNAPDQRRVIAATVKHPTLGTVRIINVYVVNGQALGSEKFEFKMKWLRALTDVMRTELKQHERVVLLGDFNIAPDDRDCYDPIGWAGQIHCSEDERSALGKLYALGLHDSLRCVEQNPVYSWWDYRQGAFRRNHGLRIDLALVSTALKSHIRAAGVDKTPRGWESPSDHAPAWLELA
jgi:exodeoxyribonuclease III